MSDRNTPRQPAGLAGEAGSHRRVSWSCRSVHSSARAGCNQRIRAHGGVAIAGASGFAAAAVFETIHGGISVDGQGGVMALACGDHMAPKQLGEHS